MQVQIDLKTNSIFQLSTVTEKSALNVITGEAYAQISYDVDLVVNN